MRKYTIKRPKEILWVFMVFVLFILGVYFYHFKEQPTLVIEPENEDSRSFDEIIRDANAAYKQTYMEAGEEAAIKTIPDSITEWQALVDKYKYNQPEEYSRTRDWDKKMDEMLVAVKTAEQQVLSDDMEGAKASLDVLDAMLEAIKEENDQIYLSDDFKDFFEVLKSVSEAEKKSEAKKHMNDLKFKFTQLKEYAVDDKYRDLIADMEKSIARIDKLLDGPDYEQAQSELKPIFAQLFLNYY